MKRKIAAVIHRWGPDIAGGESLARQVLHRLSNRLDITVLTSCARDYVSWANYYPAQTSNEGNLTVIRFRVQAQRPIRAFNLLSRYVLQRRIPALRNPLWLERLWIRWQGPYCPELVEHLKHCQANFDACLFYTYLYYPVVMGLTEAPGKSILVPTAHDERPIHLQTYRRLFRLARGFIFLSREEQEFVNRLFGTTNRPQRVASMRVPTLADPTEPTPRPEELRAFLRSRQIEQPYLLYLGRIDPAKGVDTLFEFFLRFVQEDRGDALLVLAGDRQAGIPQSDAIRYLGFLSEEEKRAAILGSRALVLFSRYESFSISVLEAMGLGRPVIVTAQSPVLKGHVERSGAGFAVDGYDQFRRAVNTVFSTGDELGRLGVKYVQENYNWDQVESAYLEMIEEVRL